MDNIQQRRNDNVRNVLKSGQRPYVLKVNRHNTKEHEKFKVLKMFELIWEGNEVFSEAELQCGGRADLYVSDINTCYEILMSETEEQLREKTKNWTCEVIGIKIKKKDVKQ
ncbi:MAG: hypothetical protein Q7R52_02440 [archaeon]|nr:hypothetical protein [archaeon]